MTTTEAERLHECGVCWEAYEPQIGDAHGQIRPGTPFDALPSTWRCPHCDAPKERFLLQRDER